ncbi:MAG: single-stranded DNA-binding protein [Thermoleophilia bacterium]
MAGSVNVVVLVGNLTRDPEMRTTPGGTTVCHLRVAVNDRVKNQNTGEWGDRPNYFDVDVFGALGDQCGQWLSKGRQVAVEGKLRWREWEAQDGQKRSAVSIVANNVQFIGPRDGGGTSSQGSYGARGSHDADQGTGAPFETGGAPARGDYAESADDDIPF